jgi:hypothetical protein
LAGVRGENTTGEVYSIDYDMNLCFRRLVYLYLNKGQPGGKGGDGGVGGTGGKYGYGGKCIIYHENIDASKDV